MPEDFYKVGSPGNRQFDEVGLRAFERDLAAWPGNPSDDLRERSQFNLFYDIGIHFFKGNRRQAMDYAMYFMERRERRVPINGGRDRQRFLKFRVSD